MKNILEGFHSRLDLAEKRIKELKDRSIKNMQSKKKKKERERERIKKKVNPQRNTEWY